MPAALSALAIFQTGPHAFFAQAGLEFSYLSPSVAGVTGVYHNAQPLLKMGSWELFAQAGLKLRFSQSLPPQ
jgi:hypothetical protein